MNYGVGIRTQYPFRWKGYGTPHNRWNVAKGFSSCVRRFIDHTLRKTDREPSMGSADTFEHSLDGFIPTPGLDPVASPDPLQRGARAVANSPDVPKRARGRPRIVLEAPKLQTVKRQRGRPRIGLEASKLDVPEQERERPQTKVITTHSEENTTGPQARECSLNAISSTTSLAENPIVRGLQWRGKGRRLDRGQIVSLDLCDDILQRLAPSLSHLAGCDIIDIHPGVCLWSSKLHHILQPRQHILVEPMMKVFSPFLRPLLDAPDSRYRLAEYKDTTDQWTPYRYIADGLLPAQEGPEDYTRNHEGQNNSLLILANMDVRRKTATRTVGGFDSHHRIMEYFRSLQEQSNFNCNRTVRMLMWMSDHEKTTLLPRTVMLRRRLAVLGELTCHIEEVAGDALEPSLRRRAPKLDFESSVQTAKRMEKANIHIPIPRLTEIPRQIQEAHASTGSGRLDILDIKIDPVIYDERDWHEELRVLEKDFADGVFPQIVGGPFGQQKSKYRNSKADEPFTPEYLRLKHLQVAKKSQRKKRSALEELLQEQEDLEALELTISEDETLDDQTHKSKREELENRQGQLQLRLDRLPTRQGTNLHAIADDKRACSISPPILQWDRRTAEPIIASPQEFHPPRTLALIDFQPRTSSINLLTKTQKRYLDAMLVDFYIYPSQSVATALNTLALGAADALIPHVPSLRDPRKGGRRDLDQLRVRLLTTEMLHELAIAWEKWPFRPSFAELMRNQSTQHDPDEGGTGIGKSRMH